MAERNIKITKNSLYNELVAKVDGIRRLLPGAHKDQAERFVGVAVTTFLNHEQREKLERCTLESIIQAVMDAATCGFALDNKFFYVIPYNNKKLIGGNEVWVYEAQAQPDYKALITLARRCGVIIDARAQVVYHEDEFSYWDENGKQVYRFQEHEGDRSNLRGAYAVATLPSGHYRFCYMSAKELDKVHKASKSPNSPAWKNWPDRMRCKAAIKRLLVGLQDDPGLARAIDLDNREYDMDRVLDGRVASARVSTFDDLTEELNNRLEESESQQQRGIEHKPDDETFVPREAEAETVPAHREEPQQQRRNVPPRPTIQNHRSGR